MYDSTPAMLVVADHADMVDVNNNSDDQDDIWLEASLQSNLGIITSSSSSSSSASMAATNGDIDSTDTVVSTIFDVPTIGLANLTALFADERLMNITRFYRQNHRPDYARNVTVLSAYAIIFLISLFGNVMVCYIIAHNRKMHNFTNYFIANLAASDLLMTMINVPFGVARMLLDDWPFGDFLCKCLPFIQSTSVYVSTITMCIISVDRYCVVIHPFGARITNWLPLGAVLALIWFISCALSIPFAYHNRVVTMNIVFQVFERCRAVYPSANYSKMLSLYAALTQYAIPLAIASVAYVRIAFGIKHRSKLGAKTPEQLQRILRTNRQTIKMLVLVLVVFAICWLPLHLFCLYRDFVDASAFSTRAFLFVHWIGMSSVSYNAFIYSARNKHFRDGMKTILSYFAFRRMLRKRSRMNSVNGTLEQSIAVTELTTLPCTAPANNNNNNNNNNNHKNKNNNNNGKSSTSVVTRFGTNLCVVCNSAHYLSGGNKRSFCIICNAHQPRNSSSSSSSSRSNSSNDNNNSVGAEPRINAQPI